MFSFVKSQKADRFVLNEKNVVNLTIFTVVFTLREIVRKVMEEGGQGYLLKSS